MGVTVELRDVPGRAMRLNLGVLAVSLACCVAGAAPAFAADPPTVTKSFGASSIPLNGTTSLSFAINSPQGTAESNVAFTDNLPSGLVVANPNGLSNLCGGTATATPGSSTVSLSGGSMAGGSLCLVSVNVTGTWGGVKDNSVTVNSANGASTPSTASLTVLPPPAGDRVYWANKEFPYEIEFANLDGSGGGDLPTGNATLTNPSGVALDPAAGRIYWANAGANTISWANLDGSAGADLFTGLATVSGPDGVALDLAAGRIYWANEGANKISYANLDGTGNGHDLTITGTATLSSPAGLAIDPAAGRIYWTAMTFPGKISYANLDGSASADLPTGMATVSFPITGVALDLVAGRAYWGDGDKIGFAKIDESGGTDLSTGTATASGITGVAIDPTAGRIYWANFGAKTISYVNLDGTGGGGDLNVVSQGNFFPALLKGPSGTGAPTITGGPNPGSVLSCSQGSWASDLNASLLYRAPHSFAYQWRLNGADIGGATSSTVTATSAGNYSCAVTASNFASSAQQTSSAFTVQPAPTGQRGAAIKKCKKKFPGKAKAKKRKKCKKRANLLPV